MSSWINRVMSVALALVLTGCGQQVAAPTGRILPQGTRPAPVIAVTPAAAAPAAAQPPALTEAQVAKLALASPDELIDNAPPEPGIVATGLMPTPPAEDLGNFGKVEETLWRGARPTEKGLEQLVAMGVKTIVNFENDKKVVGQEQAWATAHGIKFVSIPLSIVTPPRAAKMQQFLDLALNPANRPLYFHCMQGSDRTGTAAFAYRLSHDHWTYSRAYTEMVAYGFHTYLVGLRGFLLWYANHPLPVDLTPARYPQVTHGNDATLHVSPAETVPAVKAFLARATRSIYLENFSFGNDSYGRQIIPLLTAKAKAGVEVKLLIDESGSRFLKGYDQMLAEFYLAGVTVLPYRTRAMVNSEGNQSINIDHRKVYLIDGAEALVGGVNLHAPFDTTTQDLLINWRGPIVAELYEEFGRDWMSEGGPTLHQAALPSAATGSVDAKIAVTSPGENRYEARAAIFAAIDGAKHEILIEQQYLWDDALVGHLVSAVGRGVKVRALIPHDEQKLVQRYLNGMAALQLVTAGATVRLYRGTAPDAHLHTKYFAVDDAWAITGSVNGDTRSFVDNQELDIITTHPELVAELRTRLFERDWSQYSREFSYSPPSWLQKQLINLLEAIDYYF